MRWLRRVFRKSMVEKQLDAELRFHLDEQAKDNVAAGMRPEDAERSARLDFGSLDQIKEECREVSRTHWIETLVQDVRFGLRVLGKSRRFAAGAIITLGLGIGASTAIFSLVNAVMLRPFPYKQAERLVYIWTPNRNLPQVPLEALGPMYADFFDLQRECRSFSSMAMFDNNGFNLEAEGVARRVGGTRVDASFFSTLGVAPELGRTIGADDDQPGHGHTVVIADGLWRSEFGGQADVLGRELKLNGEEYRIIGVMPRGFLYPQSTELKYGDTNEKSTDVWIPMALTAQQKADRDNTDAFAIARLRPGVSVEQAQAEVGTLMERLDQLHAVEDRGWYGLVKPFVSSVVGPMQPSMWVLLGAVLLVLLISCTNTAGLLLSRMACRAQEIGLRTALGAGPGRIVQQMLAEALLVALAAGAFGAGVAYGAVRVLLRLGPGDIPRLDETSVDGRVLLFALAVAIISGIAFAIVPALAASRSDANELLKKGGISGALGTSNRLRQGLVAAEIAISVMMLAGAGLLIRSYVKLAAVPVGFSPSTLTMHISLDSRYTQQVQQTEFFQNVLDRIRELSGVEFAGDVSNLPLSHSESMSYFYVEGYANQPNQLVYARTATPHYFEAMEIPLIEGRFFNDKDMQGGGQSPVAIVNLRFAGTYLSGKSAVAGRLCFCSSPNDKSARWSAVVGVVGDVRHSNLEDVPPPVAYTPGWDGMGSYLAVKAHAPMELIPSIRAIVRKADPAVAVADVRTMEERVSEARARHRFQTFILAVFAGLALVLAAVGVYGAIAYSVRLRTAEIGIRMALGAQRRDILRLVVGQGLLPTAIGMGLGIGCALMLSRFLSFLLYGIAPRDSITFLVACVALAGVALLATYLPARRATAVDPLTALHYE